jgi:hypothetical protein
MYNEFIKYCNQIIRQKSYWLDGELWTAVIGGIGACVWFRQDPAIIELIRQNFQGLLNTVGLIFGLVFLALTLHVLAISKMSDSDDPCVQQVRQMIVDRYTWTAICYLFLLGASVAVLVLGRYVSHIIWLNCLLHSFLAFGLLYCGFQVFNHILTIWWCFKNRKRLR